MKKSNSKNLLTKSFVIFCVGLFLMAGVSSCGIFQRDKCPKVMTPVKETEKSVAIRS